jgi:putative addiction module killer protein
MAGRHQGRGRGLIKSRLDRVSLGHFGDCRGLGGGVFELRIDFGAGDRIYFAREDSYVIVPWGGTKQQQARDIARAKIYWTEYEDRGGG